MQCKKPQIIFIFLISVFLILFTGCSKKTSSQTNTKKEEPGTPVEVAPVKTGSITASYSGSATLEAEDEALVVAKIGDVVEHIYFEEGSLIKTGQILAKLYDEQYKLELQQAKSRLEKLTNEYQRNQELFQKKIISRDAFERIKFDSQSQQAVVDLAKLKLDYTSIRAPITGIVSERLIKAGNMVKLNQPCFRITDFDPLWAILHIPEKEMAKMKKNFPATVVADAIPNSTFKGIVLRISPIISAQTGTIKVTVEIKNPIGNLKSGMFARVHIIYDTHENTLLVPKNSVIIEDQESSVFVVTEKKVEKRVVEIGFVNSHHIEILSGLQEKEIVVVTGQRSLKTGTRVQVVNQ